MVRAVYIYKCATCGNEFCALDIESHAMYSSVSVCCPQCGGLRIKVPILATLLHKGIALIFGAKMTNKFMLALEF